MFDTIPLVVLFYVKFYNFHVQIHLTIWILYFDGDIFSIKQSFQPLL